MSAGIGWGLVALAALVLFAYDLTLVRNGQKSMSRLLTETALKRPIVPFALGLLIGAFIGHWFFPLDSCLEALRKGTL